MLYFVVILLSLSYYYHLLYNQGYHCIILSYFTELKPSPSYFKKKKLPNYLNQEFYFHTYPGYSIIIITIKIFYEYNQLDFNSGYQL